MRGKLEPHGLEVQRMQARNHGYTLYELLLSFGLVALLLSAGLPSFSKTLAKARQSIEINALFHAIHVARKESIMRHRVVSICPGNALIGCEPATDWSDGWIMFENTDRDSPPQLDPNEPVLRVHSVADSVRIRANRRSFTLRATFLRATNGTFVICDAAERIAGKALVVSYTGRPRVAFEQGNGDPWACPD